MIIMIVGIIVTSKAEVALGADQLDIVVLVIQIVPISTVTVAQLNCYRLSNIGKYLEMVIICVLPQQTKSVSKKQFTMYCRF